MKKKETLWELLKRLDEEAGQFSEHLQKANHYFDQTASTTQKLLDQHERDLHKLIVKVRRSLKIFMEQKEKKAKKNKK
jgi:hypothetical protein